jgi:predicted enzyme related to lactoylglutathione lyase
VSNHPIVHIEFPANNPEAAGKFYADAFGWNVTSDDMYHYVQFRAEGGPGGGFVSTSEEGTDSGMVHYKPDSVLLYIGTDDIDASLEKVNSLGGKTLLPKTEIPHVGWFAIFSDPTGNRVALFKGMGQQG